MPCPYWKKIKGAGRRPAVRETKTKEPDPKFLDSTVVCCRTEIQWSGRSAIAAILDVRPYSISP
jgi:hypothetical protein